MDVIYMILGIVMKLFVMIFGRHNELIGGVTLLAVGGITEKIGEHLTGRAAVTRGTYGHGRMDLEHVSGRAGSDSLKARGIGYLMVFFGGVIVLIGIGAIASLMLG